MGRFLAVPFLLLAVSCSGAFNPVPVVEAGTIRAVTITDGETSLILRLRTWGGWTMETVGGAATLNPGEIYALQPGAEFRLRIDIAEIIYGDFLIFNDRWLSPLDRQNLQLWYESDWNSWPTIEL